MNGFHRIFLAGNLGKKPLVKKNSQGKAYTFLSVATHRMSLVDGSWNKRTLWHSVLVLGQKAQLCEKYLHKGSALAVEGFMEPQEDKTQRIIAQEVHFLGKNLREPPN